MLALKGNHPTLHEDVRTFFEEAQERSFRGIAHDLVQQTDGGHGRIEVRQCWCSSDVAWLADQRKWKGLRTIACVESRRLVGQTQSHPHRSYLTSLPAHASVIAHAVRGHRGIENRLHRVLDMSMSLGEDGSRVRKAHAPENLGPLRRIALNLLRQEPSKGSLKGKRKRAGWDETYLSTVLGI